jgi:hypothetical protein
VSTPAGPDGGDPGTIAEVDEFLRAFAADPRDERYQDVIDMLLDKRNELAP